MCVCAGVHAPRCVCVCACVCVLGGDRSRLFASRVQVVEMTAVYLTGCSDCVTGYREPLSTPFRCHTGLKNV